MSVKDLAVHDIKEDLEKIGKCFIAFHTELDDVMDTLVTDQIQAQELCQENSRKVTRSQL